MVENSYLGRALKCFLTYCGCLKVRLFEIRQWAKVVRDSELIKWLECLCEYFLICMLLSYMFVIHGLDMHVNKTCHLNSTNTSLYPKESSKLNFGHICT